jgi:hypothetical protein
MYTLDQWVIDHTRLHHTILRCSSIARWNNESIDFGCNIRKLEIDLINRSIDSGICNIHITTALIRRLIGRLLDAMSTVLLGQIDRFWMQHPRYNYSDKSFDFGCNIHDYTTLTNLHDSADINHGVDQVRSPSFSHALTLSAQISNRSNRSINIL